MNLNMLGKGLQINTYVYQYVYMYVYVCVYKQF